MVRFRKAMLIFAAIFASLALAGNIIVIIDHIELMGNTAARHKILSSKPPHLAAAAYISIISSVLMFADMLIAAILRFKEKSRSPKVGVLWMISSLLSAALIILSTVYWYNRIRIGDIRGVSTSVVDVMVPIIIGLVFTVSVIVCSVLGAASNTKRLKETANTMGHSQQGYPQQCFPQHDDPQQNITDNNITRS